jgi:hypothetical protein
MDVKAAGNDRRDSLSCRSEPRTEPAYLFEDRQIPGDWHVQWTDDDGGFEMAIFSGPRAHERAIMFAERCYSGYEEVRTGQR